MLFTYDKKADREVVRFAAQGAMLGLATGAVYGALLLISKNPLLMGSILVIVNFALLFPSEKWAKILYWNLAILLQAIGLVTFGLIGALIGFLLWLVALAIVPWLRYVLQKENVISVSAAAVITWAIVAAIWGVDLLNGGQLGDAGILGLAILGLLIGVLFWGVAKIISSGFKEYHFRHHA
jgi:hypothetical protein